MTALRIECRSLCSIEKWTGLMSTGTGRKNMAFTEKKWPMILCLFIGKTVVFWWNFNLTTG